MKHLSSLLEKNSFGGFYTSDVRENNKRKGFNITSFNGSEGEMASTEMKSENRVSQYGVNVPEIERIGVTAIYEALNNHEVIIVDEIGKMELLSIKFREAIEKALNSNKILIGTIMQKDTDPFVCQIKKRNDTKIINLTRSNATQVEKEIECHLLPYLKVKCEPCSHDCIHEHCCHSST